MYNKTIVIGRTKEIQKQELTEKEKKNNINTKVRFVVRNTSFNSERQEVINEYPIICYNRQAECVLKYVNENDLVCIEGKVRYEEYEKKLSYIYADRVVFLTSKNKQA